MWSRTRRSSPGAATEAPAIADPTAHALTAIREVHKPAAVRPASPASFLREVH
jgi:hypothetical protein